MDKEFNRLTAVQKDTLAAIIAREDRTLQTRAINSLRRRGWIKRRISAGLTVRDAWSYEASEDVVAAWREYDADL